MALPCWGNAYKDDIDTIDSHPHFFHTFWLRGSDWSTWTYFIQSDDAFVCFLIRDYCDESIATEQDDNSLLLIAKGIDRLS